MKNRLLLLLLIPFLFLSCEKGEDDQPGQNEISRAKTKILNSEIDFSMRLFEQVLNDRGDENLAVSPYSAFMALSMAANGAKEETLEEMLDVLGIGGKRVIVLNEAIKEINESLLYSDPDTWFQSANSVWCNENIRINEDYKNDVQDYYDAKSQDLDFSDPASLDIINGWVEDKSEGKITELLNVVNPSDICYIINALYFNGIWTDIFDPKKTKLRPFRTPNNEDVMVPTMEKWDDYNVYRENGVTGIELPYGNQNWSMFIFLPSYNNPYDILGLLKETLMDDFGKILEKFEEESIGIRLPQFKIRNDFEMDDYLKAMGIEKAFLASEADFSNLTNAMCWIGGVIQKTYLRVNEDGTEAAAATAIPVVGAGRSIYINSPFIYLIREKTTGSILFLGQVVNPNEAS